MLIMLKSLFTTFKGQLIFFGLGLLIVVFLLVVREYSIETDIMTEVDYNISDYKPIEINRKNSPYKDFEVKKHNNHSDSPIHEKNNLVKQDNQQSHYTKEKSSPLLKILSNSKNQGPLISKKPANLPLDLFTTDQEEEQSISSLYAPYGRLIPCETVITIDSSKMNTPVVALVTEDVVHDGNVIIPAGAEIHGRASPDNTRERVDASGSWVVVWRNSTEFNGLEMELTGIALDRSINFSVNQWGIDDGSAGLKGTLIKSSSWAEARLFASQFLSGLTYGVQEKRLAPIGLGEAQLVPQDTMKNSLLQGTQSVIDQYAKKILEEIDTKGFYVRVPAGTQFYLYVTQTIDIQNGKKGNLIGGSKNIWNNEKS